MNQTFESETTTTTTSLALSPVKIFRKKKNNQLN